MSQLVFNMYEHLRKLVTEDKLETSIGKAWSPEKQSSERLDENVGKHVKHALGMNEAEQPNAGNVEIPAKKDLENHGPNLDQSEQGAGVTTKPKSKDGDQKIKDVNKIGDATDKVGIAKVAKTATNQKDNATMAKAQKGGVKPGYKPVKETVVKEDFNNGGVPSNGIGDKKGQEKVLGTFSDEKVAQDLAREKHGEVVKDEKNNTWKVILKESVEVIICQDGEPKAVLDIGDDGSVVGHDLVKEGESEEGSEESSEEPVDVKPEEVAEEPVSTEYETANKPEEEKTEKKEEETGAKEIVPGKIHEDIETEITNEEELLNGARLLVELLEQGVEVDARTLSQEITQYLQRVAEKNMLPESKKQEIERKISESADDFTLGYSEALQKSIKDVLGVSIEASKVVSKLKSLQRPELELLKQAMISGDVEALRHFLNAMIGPKEAEVLVQ